MHPEKFLRIGPAISCSTNTHFSNAKQTYRGSPAGFSSRLVRLPVLSDKQTGVYLPNRQFLFCQLYNTLTHRSHSCEQRFNYPADSGRKAGNTTFVRRHQDHVHGRTLDRPQFRDAFSQLFVVLVHFFDCHHTQTHDKRYSENHSRNKENC